MKPYEGYILVYIGDGAFLPGVPARDLSKEDIRASNYNKIQLIKSGLYRQPTVTVTRARHGGTENHSAKDDD